MNVKDYRIHLILELILVICLIIQMQITDCIKNRYEIFHNKHVKVVDVMYTYQKDGKTIEGDYSFVSHNGYEYAADQSGYSLEFEEGDK